MPHPISNGLLLRKGSSTDIPWIRSVETAISNRRFIGTFSDLEHGQNLVDPDYLYFVLEKDAAPVAFAILRGAAGSDRVIEIKRIATSNPGNGFGRDLLLALIRLVFLERNDRRIWLDVVGTNERAKHLYRSLHFTREGMLRQHYVTTDGEVCDIEIFGMLRSEFLDETKN